LSAAEFGPLHRKDSMLLLPIIDSFEGAQDDAPPRSATHFLSGGKEYSVEMSSQPSLRKNFLSRLTELRVETFYTQV
jgi:hypothetical protein